MSWVNYPDCGPDGTLNHRRTRSQNFTTTLWRDLDMAGFSRRTIPSHARFDAFEICLGRPAGLDGEGLGDCRLDPNSTGAFLHTVNGWDVG